MIITLSGITGCGKSYYKNLLIKKLNIENMIIYTTREKRKDEINGIDKHFVTKNELEKLIKTKEVFANYEFLGENYAYGKKYLQEDMCCVTELHYEWIKDFKQKGKDVYSIYIIPKDIELAKSEIKKRNLAPNIEKMRLQEVEEHIENMKNNQDLKKQFDNVFLNNYDEESCNRMIELVKNINTTKNDYILV